MSELARTYAAAIRENAPKLSAHQAAQDSLLEAWANEVAPHKVGDVIAHVCGKMTKARVISFKGRADGANGGMLITFLVKPLKLDESDSKFELQPHDWFAPAGLV